MLRYMLVLYLLSVVSHHHVNCHSICSTGVTTTGRRIYAVGYNNDLGPCVCNITVKRSSVGYRQDGSKTSVIIKRGQLYGDCDCKIVRNSTITNCPLDTGNFTMDLTSNIKLQMTNDVVGYGGVCFNFSVTTVSSAFRVYLSCQNVSNTDEEALTTADTPYPDTTIVSRKPDTNSTIEKSTRLQTTSKVNTDNIPDDNNDNSMLPIILGCSIGAILGVILVVIIACVLLRKLKQQKKTSSNTDDSLEIPQNVYSNPDSQDNYVNDFHRYEHLPKQREPVPNTCIETESDLSQDNRIELNHNSIKVNENNEYENVLKV